MTSGSAPGSLSSPPLPQRGTSLVPSTLRAAFPTFSAVGWDDSPIGHPLRPLGILSRRYVFSAILRAHCASCAPLPRALKPRFLVPPSVTGSCPLSHPLSHSLLHITYATLHTHFTLPSHPRNTPPAIHTCE